jgi:vacuolar-type H+-ATPase subunit I/STV1
LRDIEGLERTLKALKLRLLRERKEKLERKLAEIEVHYRELLEFEGRAKEDRVFMLSLRRELSEENRSLRERLGCGT